MKNLRELLEHEVRELFATECQLMEALPKILRTSLQSSLKQTLQDYLGETHLQIIRLEKVAKLLGISLESAEKCEGMKLLLEEVFSIIQDEPDPELVDAVLFCMAQKVEHYEIVGYGTARHFARLLGEEEVATLLGATLEEEEKEPMANPTLSTTAKSHVNEWSTHRTQPVRKEALVVPLFTGLGWLTH